MSVLVTLRAPADVAKFEKLAVDDPSIFEGILRRAKERGGPSMGRMGRHTTAAYSNSTISMCHCVPFRRK